MVTLKRQNIRIREIEKEKFSAQTPGTCFQLNYRRIFPCPIEEDVTKQNRLNQNSDTK